MNDASAPSPPPRGLPATDLYTVPYWTGGAKGQLLIVTCKYCAYLVHPPTSFCPRCECRNVAPAPVSGRGTIESFTINYKQWMPGLPVPYVVALVALEEQPEVRLPTNIVGCHTEAVRLGMKVKVSFEQAEDLWIPLFTPEDDA
jgi:uncharacterized OB-fold protein